jgi:putative transcriptional regulator
MKETPKRLPVADQIRKGLEEAVRHAKGEITLKATTLEFPDRPPEVRAEDVTRIRLNNQMSQNVFARLLNVSPKTVQSWEHGTRRPSQAALRLIQLLEQNPHGVFSVVGMSPPRQSPSTKRKNTASAKSGRRSQPRSLSENSPLADVSPC